MPYLPVLLIAGSLLLSACGADGPPLPPQEAPRQTDGVRFSGDARIGVAYNSQPGIRG